MASYAFTAASPTLPSIRPAACSPRTCAASRPTSLRPKMQSETPANVSRRVFLSTILSAAAASTMSASAALASSASLTGDYSQDAAAVLSDMRQACDLARGTPGMADTVSKTRREMNDFVALYRRNEKVAGSTSFSTLYTAINTLSGHFASYGNSYPVPEKRKKRLNQQFTDIDRALNRGR